MEQVETGFKGLIELRPRVFGDERGWFMESFKNSSYSDQIDSEAFVQDNISHSSKGVLRGLHFQKPPYAQSKLVMVLRGKALDVVVDLRKSSQTYGQHFSLVLDSTLKNQLFVPRGFAHGFLTLEEDTTFLYKCDNEYHQASEETLQWNDSALHIDWGLSSPQVSEKDKVGLSWSDFDSPFN